MIFDALNGSVYNHLCSWMGAWIYSMTGKLQENMKVVIKEAWYDRITERLTVPAVAQQYQQPLKALIEEPLKVVSVNNCCVEMDSPQKNKLAVLCFPCVVTGNSFGKEKMKGLVGFFESFCLLIHYVLKSWETWLRTFKFIEIHFSGEVGVSRSVKPCTEIFGEWGRELLLWPRSLGGMCRSGQGGNL